MEWIREAISWFLNFIGEILVEIISWIYKLIFEFFPLIIFGILGFAIKFGILYVIYLIFSKIMTILDKGAKSSSKSIKYISKILIVLIYSSFILGILFFVGYNMYLELGIRSIIAIFLIMILAHYINKH